MHMCEIVYTSLSIVSLGALRLHYTKEVFKI